MIRLAAVSEPIPPAQEPVYQQVVSRNEISADRSDDRIALRGCLEQGGTLEELRVCADLVEARCWADLPTGALRTTAQQRWCNHRTAEILNDELHVTLAALGGWLNPEARARLLAGQAAWEQGLASDTSLASNVMRDDVLAGAEGSGVRVRAIAERIAFLEYNRGLAELNAAAH